MADVRLSEFVVWTGVGEAFGEEAVSDPGLRLDVLLVGFGFELAADLADEDAEVFVLLG